MKIIDIIMLFLLMVFSPMAALLEIPRFFHFRCLGIYGLTVLLGLFLMAFVF
jgi:hypothetical protein